MKKSFVISLVLIGSMLLSAEPSEPKVSSAEARLLRSAEALAETGDDAKALAMIENSLTETSSAAIYYSAAVYAMEKEDNETAEKFLHDSLRRMPKFYRARLTLGQVLLEREKFPEAVKQFTWLVDSDYENKALVWKMLGYCLMQAKHWQAAETAYREALVRNPADDEVRRALLHVLLAGEKSAELRPMLNEMLAEKINDKELWQLAVAVEYLDGRQDKALRKLLMADFAGATDKAMLLSLASQLFENELYKDAASIYKRLMKDYNLETKVALQAAEAFMSVEDLGTAEKLLHGEKRFENAQEKWLLLKARLLRMQGKLKQAVIFYEKLLKSFPLCGDGLMDYAELNRDIGESSKAYDLLRRASLMEKYSRRSFIGMGQLLVDKKEYKKAVYFLEKAQKVRFDKNVERYLSSVKRLAVEN